MAVRGTKPKPDGQKRNRVKSPIDWTEVADVPFTDGPALPEREQGWPAATQRWWSAVSTMPHCRLWSDADWQFALDTARVAAAFHAGDVRAAAELRLRDKTLGTTMDARRDLRIRYVDPAKVTTEEAPAGVASLDAYRSAIFD